MSRFVGPLAALAIALALARPAAASCAPPAPLADNAARADLVVHGTVTKVSGGALTLRVDRVLKGAASATVTIYAGPERGGSGGTVVATSVDYRADLGTDHVIYAVKAADGQLETNACVGSHPGGPSAEEQAFFGPGASPAPGSGIAGVPGSDAASDWPDQPAVLALAAIVLIATIVLGSRFLMRASSGSGRRV